MVCDDAGLKRYHLRVFLLTIRSGSVVRDAAGLKQRAAIYSHVWVSWQRGTRRRRLETSGDEGDDEA